MNMREKLLAFHSHLSSWFPLSRRVLLTLEALASHGKATTSPWAWDTGHGDVP